MRKKSILISGVLWALMLTSNPAISSAGEFVGDCSSGATCEGIFTGGEVVLEDDSGGAAGRITCTETSGVVIGTSGSSTGTASLTTKGCKEGVSGGSCTSPGTPAGTIHTGNGIVAHLIYIDATPTILVGILATNLKMTFTCQTIIGSISKTVTGSVIAQITNPECGKPRISFTGTFSKGETAGSQRYTQVTTVGTVFNLTSGNHVNDTTKSSITSTGTVTLTAGKTLTLTC